MSVLVWLLLCGLVVLAVWLVAAARTRQRARPAGRRGAAPAPSATVWDAVHGVQQRLAALMGRRGDAAPPAAAAAAAARGRGRTGRLATSASRAASEAARLGGKTELDMSNGLGKPLDGSLLNDSLNTSSDTQVWRVQPKPRNPLYRLSSMKNMQTLERYMDTPTKKRTDSRSVNVR